MVKLTRNIDGLRKLSSSADKRSKLSPRTAWIRTKKKTKCRVNNEVISPCRTAYYALISFILALNLSTTNYYFASIIIDNLYIFLVYLHKMQRVYDI